MKSNVALSRSLPAAKLAFEKKDINILVNSHTCNICEKGHKSHAIGIDAMKYYKLLGRNGSQGIIISCVLIVVLLSLTVKLALLCSAVLSIIMGVGFTVASYAFNDRINEMKLFKRERAREKWECENYIEGEQKEMIELYISKGLSRKEAETVIGILSNHQKLFVDIMMVEELGLIPPEQTGIPPLETGVITFFSFFIGGTVPLLPFIVDCFFNKEATFPSPVSIFIWVILSVLLLTSAIGFIEAHINVQTWWAVEAFLVFSLAAAIIMSLVVVYYSGLLFSLNFVHIL